MRKQFIATLVSGLFAISTSVLAEECGNRSGDSVYIMDCIAERYKATESELNELYRQAMQSLSDEGKKKLADAQSAWLQYRNASLALITEINRKTGSTGNVIIEDYRVTLTKKRIAELRYVLKGPGANTMEW
jgi:uncharacterized protein YecT (DUF1311 family)